MAHSTNSRQRPLSRYLNNGHHLKGGNLSYQENNFNSRPLSNFENSSVAMSQRQRGASKHLFAAQSIGTSVKVADKTNSGHNMLIYQGVDSPKLERFSSNSSKGEKETLKKHK